MHREERRKGEERREGREASMTRGATGDQVTRGERRKEQRRRVTRESRVASSCCDSCVCPETQCFSRSERPSSFHRSSSTGRRRVWRPTLVKVQSATSRPPSHPVSRPSRVRRPVSGSRTEAAVSPRLRTPRQQNLWQTRWHRFPCPPPLLLVTWLVSGLPLPFPRLLFSEAPCPRPTGPVSPAAKRSPS